MRGKLVFILKLFTAVSTIHLYLIVLKMAFHTSWSHAAVRARGLGFQFAVCNFFLPWAISFFPWMISFRREQYVFTVSNFFFPWVISFCCDSCEPQNHILTVTAGSKKIKWDTNGLPTVYRRNGECNVMDFCTLWRVAYWLISDTLRLLINGSLQMFPLITVLI